MTSQAVPFAACVGTREWLSETARDRAVVVSNPLRFDALLFSLRLGDLEYVLHLQHLLLCLQLGIDGALNRIRQDDITNHEKRGISEASSTDSRNECVSIP
jgi:hypothetical protein